MSSPTIIGTTVIGGRYVVERQLGYGATSTVYLCRDRQTTNLVAVKVLRAELAESLGADRFLREIRLTAGLEHPNIVPVIDSGADGSTLYCVLPYMEGGTLRDMLLASRQLPIERAIDIGCTIARALAYAHAKGLIHRDIKPENILFGNGRAHLGDFGIARLLHATAGELTTTTGVVRGTPAYMSPEQASGERNYDGRSDIYSLAAVVYEMVSGMPPFTGPTAQSVLAQRFSTTPRPMRTYRSTVSAELDRVVAKAMCTSPADRQATAEQFAEELEASGASGDARWSMGRTNRVAMVGSAVALVIIAGVAFTLGQRGSALRGFGDLPDTTQLAVLPFQRDANTESLGSVDAFLYDAFSAWRGITVVDPFQVRDEVARRQSVSGVERDRAVALSLGAGRFVRGEVNALPGGGGWRVHASLYQLQRRRDTLLFDHSITITPEQLRTINERYGDLAAILLLRGAGGSAGTALVTTTVLPAMQDFTNGIAAINEWDFATADSLFEQAISLDPEYRRAYLWQAQVRFWQRSGTQSWAPLAEKALVDTTRLPARDIQLARALVALGRGKYDDACREYDALRRKNDADFAAWFGLGRCRDLDFRIVRDARSPTGWKYVSSYGEAVAAYQKAFQVLSLSHRSLERGAFEPLRELLFMRPSKLQLAVPPRGERTAFVGRLDLEDGQPILRPIPLALISAGDPAGVPSGMREAILSQQRIFAAIAAAWSTALPRSAGAKEAVAVALEMRGDRASLDTLRAGRNRATESEARLRLAAAEVVLRLKFANPSDSGELVLIRKLADSVLAANPSPTPREASHLAALAALTGRCTLTGRLVEEAPFSNLRGVSRDVLGATDALTTMTLLGCARDPASGIRQLRKRIETSSAPPAAVENLLTRAVQAMQARDTSLTSSFARGGSYLIRAQQALYQNQRDTIRAILARVDAARARTGYDDISPDATFLESRVLLGVGDTAEAVARLDRALDRLPFLTPGMLNRPIEMSGLMRLIALRGELPAARDHAAARWLTAQRILWLSSGR